MKVSTAKIIIYGLFGVGALVAFIVVLIPALSDLLAVFSLVGGLIVLLGILFCIIIVRAPCCPHCHEPLSIRNRSVDNCPHCEKELG